MKKGYYIHFQGRQSIGVSKKIDMQLSEFCKLYEMEEIEVETPVRTLFRRIIGLFPTMSIQRNYQKALEQIKEPDFLYVRRTVADRAYVALWKEIRRRYPQCKIIIEIYTYPYDKDDFAKWNAWPFYLKEIIYRPRLKRYIDRFVTYSEDKEIFGVPTICTTNGVNVNDVAVVKGVYQKNKITLIGVAYMQRHHGYERIIEGLHEYSQKDSGEYDIELLLVGDGPEKGKYQQLVEKYSLQDSVKFYPTMSGKDLDAMYDRSDIALASFGMYKLGYYGTMGALKTRECLAKGMPLITGCRIDVLDDEYPYVKNFDNDSSPVNMDEIVDFFKEIRKENKSKQDIATVIRKFAFDHVSMEKVMKPIVDYIES